MDRVSLSVSGMPSAVPGRVRRGDAGDRDWRRGRRDTGWSVGPEEFPVFCVVPGTESMSGWKHRGVEEVRTFGARRGGGVPDGRNGRLVGVVNEQKHNGQWG